MFGDETKPVIPAFLFVLQLVVQKKIRFFKFSLSMVLKIIRLVLSYSRKVNKPHKTVKVIKLIRCLLKFVFSGKKQANERGN